MIYGILIGWYVAMACWIPLAFYFDEGCRSRRDYIYSAIIFITSPISIPGGVILLLVESIWSYKQNTI